MSAIKRMSLVDQVYAKIREQIVSLELPLGSKINVNKMQEEYGVSSTPVREALNRLLNEGLIELENNVGARVIDISERKVREIQELSSAYELAAVRYALQTHAKEQMMAELEKALEHYAQAKDARGICNCLKKMKEIFYKYADNALLISKSTSISGLEEILHNLFALTKDTDAAQSVYQEGYDYLEDIVRAVREDDFAGACDAFDAHRAWARKYIVENLQKLKGN
jgi:DNA-binding GntR family transcriptional regulator